MLESISLRKQVPPEREGSRKLSWVGAVGVAIVLVCVFAAVVVFISSLSRSKPVPERMESKISTFSATSSVFDNAPFADSAPKAQSGDLTSHTQQTQAWFMEPMLGSGATGLADSALTNQNGGFTSQTQNTGFASQTQNDPFTSQTHNADAGTSTIGSSDSFSSDGLCDGIETSTVEKLTPPQPEGVGFFGVDTVLLEDTLVVGSNFDDELDGAVHIFYRDDESAWNEVQKLQPTDPLEGQLFGMRVYIFEEYPNVLFVHTLWGGTSKGVTIFKRNSAEDLYSKVGQLTVSDAGPGDGYFGIVMASEGTTLMLGFWKYSNRGAVFIFEATSEDGTGWLQVQKLMAEDDLGDIKDGFGTDIVLTDEFLAVSASHAHPSVVGGGAVYLFEKTDSVWTQFDILYPNEGSAAYTGFNWITLSDDGKTLAVGAFGDTLKGDTAGTVYIFSNTDGEKDWRFTQQVYGADTNEGDNFGHIVYFYEEFLLVGAVRANGVNAENSGAVYVFCEEDGEWEQANKLSASDGAPETFFGISISMEDNNLVIAAHRDSEGALYIYELE